MTAAEAYELTTRGGTTDFARVVATCNAAASRCLVGGMAVNVFVEPVYTLDADLAVVASGPGELGIPVGVACLQETVQGKLWAYSDPKHRFSKRKKTSWT